VSPAVGSRRFRDVGGMPPSGFEPHSGHYLSFAEREEIAICRAYGYGVREIARASGSFSVDDLPRTAPERSDRGGQLVYRAVIAQWHRDRRARRPKTAKLAANDTYRRAAARRKLTRRIRTLVRFWMGDPSARQ
jgi:hypothetical protein